MAYSNRGLGAASSVPVRHQWIPGGDLGVSATLLAMRSLARGARRDARVVTAARNATAASVSPTVQAQLLRSWLLAHTQFQADPATVELVRTPLEQLTRIARTGVMRGDCDDVAVLGAALALALGLRARFVVLGFGAANAPYQHVYAEAVTPDGGVVDFDVTRTAATQAPSRVARMEV